MKIYLRSADCVAKAGMLVLKNDFTWMSSSQKNTVPIFFPIVSEQLSTCSCCHRQICHGDGCHPGRLPGASHPCGEDGWPLRARCTSQTDVEAGGGGPAAGAGLNAELVAGRPAPVSCPAGVCSRCWQIHINYLTGLNRSFFLMPGI